MRDRHLIIFTLLGVSGCASVGSIADYSDLTIQVAEYKLMQAEQSGGTWLGSDELLSRAREAYARKDYPLALNLSRQARFEGETAHAQNLSQKDAKPWQY